MTLDTWIMLATTVVGLVGTYAALRRDLRRDLGGEIRRVEQSLGVRIDGVGERLGRVEDRVERLDDRVYALAVGLRPILDPQSSPQE